MLPGASAMSRCCSPASRRRSWPAIAPRARAPSRRAGARSAPSSWTTACRTRHWRRICRSRVVDGRRGLGNGEVIPAGPLRAPFDFQLGLVDAIVVREPEEDGVAAAGVHERMRRGFPGPVLAARVGPSGDTAWLADRPLVAFAGIANPERFFALARTARRARARARRRSPTTTSSRARMPSACSLWPRRRRATS